MYKTTGPGEAVGERSGAKQDKQQEPSWSRRDVQGGWGAGRDGAEHSRKVESREHRRGVKNKCRLSGTAGSGGVGEVLLLTRGSSSHHLVITARPHFAQNLNSSWDPDASEDPKRVLLNSWEMCLKWCTRHGDNFYFLWGCSHKTSWHLDFEWSCNQQTHNMGVS